MPVVPAPPAVTTPLLSTVAILVSLELYEIRDDSVTSIVEPSEKVPVTVNGICSPAERKLIWDGCTRRLFIGTEGSTSRLIGSDSTPCPGAVAPEAKMAYFLAAAMVAGMVREN